MMNKRYSKTEMRGLPGGPNQQFTYVTGVFMQDMYHVPKAQEGIENNANKYLDKSKQFLTDWYSSDIAKQMLTESYKKQYEGTPLKNYEQAALSNLKQRIDNINSKINLEALPSGHGSRGMIKFTPRNLLEREVEKNVGASTSKNVNNIQTFLRENIYHPLKKYIKNNKGSYTDPNKNLLQKVLQSDVTDNFMDNLWNTQVNLGFFAEDTNNLNDDYNIDLGLLNKLRYNQAKLPYYEMLEKEKTTNRYPGYWNPKEEGRKYVNPEDFHDLFQDPFFKKNRNELSKKYNTIYYNQEKYLDELPNTMLHELGHLSTDGNFLIPNEDIRTIQKELPSNSRTKFKGHLLNKLVRPGYKDAYGKNLFAKEKENQKLLFKSLPYGYYDNPTEVQTRLNIARSKGKEFGWDAMKRKATKKDVEQLKKSKNRNIQELFKNYSPEHILEMLNSVVMEDQGQELPIGQEGGEGYRINAPGYNDPYKVIPSGNITMTEQDGGDLKKGPLLGIDNMGNQQMMFPGYNYVFPGDMVMEIPVAQKGKGNFSVKPFARAFPINEPEFRALTGDIGIDTNIKNKPTYFRTSVRPTFGYSPLDPFQTHNLDLKGEGRVGYRIGDFNTELGVQKNLMRSDDPQLQASLGFNNRKFGINASTNIPTKNNPNFFPRVDLRYSPNEKLTFTGDAEYDSITKSPRFNVGLNYRFMQEGKELQKGQKGKIIKSIFDQYPGLYNVASPKDYKPIKAKGKHLEHLETTGTDVEYFAPGDTWYPFQYTTDIKLSVPGSKNKHRILYNPNLQNIEEALKLDIISHSYNTPETEALKADLDSKLRERYGDSMVDGNGGVDGYIRGYLSNSEEYAPYKKELEFLPKDYFKPFIEGLMKKQKGGGVDEFQRILKKYTTKGWPSLTEEEKNFYSEMYRGNLPQVTVQADGPNPVIDAMREGRNEISNEITTAIKEGTPIGSLLDMYNNPQSYVDAFSRLPGVLFDRFTSPLPYHVSTPEDMTMSEKLSNMLEVAPGVGVLGYGAKKASKALTTGPLKNTYKYNPFSNKLHEYNRIVAQDAVEDALKSNLIRTGKPKNYKKGPGINLDRRGATAFPSFGKKGEGPDALEAYYNDILKRGNTPYIISTDRAMKLSTLGRHGKGSTMFPVDESGKYLKQFPLSEADIYSYQPHWLKGYKKIKQKGGEFQKLVNKYTTKGWQSLTDQEKQTYKEMYQQYK